MAPSHKQWLIPFAIQLIPSALLFMGSFWLKETPRWLMSKGKREKAIKNLCWIRQLPEDDIYIKEELYAMDQNIEQQEAAGGQGFWQPFKLLAKSRKIQWRFFLGGMLFFWQNASGINAINYYSPTVFKSLGITGTNTGLFTTGLFGVVKTAGTIIYLLFLIDQVGRRRLLMIGSIGGSLCMWYVGAYIKIAQPAENPTSTLPPSGVSAVFFFYLWTVSISSPTAPDPTNTSSGILHSHMEPHPMGHQFRDVRPKRTNTRSRFSSSKQLALELPHLTLHTSDVCYNGLRSVLLLCCSHDLGRRIRLFPRSRDEEYPARGHRPSLRSSPFCTQGSQSRLGGIAARRRSSACRSHVWNREGRHYRDLCACRGCLVVTAYQMWWADWFSVRNIHNQ